MPCEGFLSAPLSEANLYLRTLDITNGYLRLLGGYLGGYLGVLVIMVIGIVCLLKGIFPRLQLIKSTTIRRVATELLLIGMILIIIGTALGNEPNSSADWAWWPQIIDYCTTIHIVFCVVAFFTLMNILQLFLALFVGKEAAESAVGGILSSSVIGIYMWLLYNPTKKLFTSLKKLRQHWRDDD